MTTKQSRVLFGERNATYKNIFDKSNYTRKHRIYNRFFELLSNARIRNIKSGKILPYIFHPSAEMPERAGLETEIIDDAEHYLSNYEVVRDVPGRLHEELRRRGENDLIVKNRIVTLPGFILNALVCESLEKEFSRADVLACDGFILRENYVRLDLDETYSKSGFLMPVETNGLITALRVFRFPNDERPFILKSRNDWRQNNG
jgi:hypothetical protein